MARTIKGKSLSRQEIQRARKQERQTRRIRQEISRANGR